MPDTPTDRQSLAFRDATAADWMGTEDLSECDVYADDDPRPIRTPEEYEAEQWDAGRETPKSLAEAKDALAERIANPDAPDGDEVAHAYDHVEGGA